MAFAHAGCAAVRYGCRRASSDQCAVSPGQLYSVVSGFQADDRCGLAQCLCSDAVCNPSPQCGIGGLGGRTQKRAEYVFLDAGHVQLCPLCGKTGSSEVSMDFAVFYSGFDGQTHAGDLAVCFASAGFLAAGPDERRRARHGRQSKNGRRNTLRLPVRFFAAINF